MTQNGPKQSVDWANYYQNMENQYHKVLENMFEPFVLYQVLYDEDGEPRNVKFINMNPAYEEFFCIAREDMLGKTFLDVWSHSYEWLKNILRAAKTQETVAYEGYSAECRAHMRALAFPIVPDKVAVLFLDVSDIKKSERALAYSKNKLHRYRQELRRLAIRLSLSEEMVRKEIAATIHDTIGFMHLRLLNRFQEVYDNTYDEDEREPFKEMLSLIERLIEESRSLTFQISSPILYQVGLGAALKDLGERIFLGENILFSYSGPLSDQLIDENICILLFQMVRELLLNALKHSQARTVSLIMRRREQTVRIVVEDDGMGFAPTSHEYREKDDHFGLFSIKERLKYIGGKLEIYSEPGKGSTLYITAPASIDSKGGVEDSADLRFPGRRSSDFS